MNAKLETSLQVELIRNLQEEHGHVPCFATPVALTCTKKQSECSWRQDCFHEDEEPDESWNSGGAAEQDGSWLKGDSYQCDSDISSH
ncbi:MAG: hypothetical protein Q8J80_06470 [Gallionella sp.]|nr:hypothetical protein [Gallionella sp.]